MIGLLLRFYPARWRARYGDEFAALLGERQLGPFDVADVLLGALDAHLHLRGLGAASEHAKGFAMSLRIGGFAAIAGGILWFSGFALSSINQGSDALFALALGVGTLALLIALIGLSAFQARQYPRLVWAAFIVPALGAIVSLVGMVGMATMGDLPFIGSWSGWSVWAIGVLALIVRVGPVRLCNRASSGSIPPSGHRAGHQLIRGDPGSARGGDAERRSARGSGAARSRPGDTGIRRRLDRARRECAAYRPLPPRSAGGRNCLTSRP